ncbi:MAG: sulfotransferase [Alphaproteobacteria bacterium]|nr:sulfotransferase [Alphaproteobacteria bacterium]
MVVNVCSAASSGSTLLSYILNRHPDIVCGDELSVFSKTTLYDNYEYVRRMSPLIRLVGISSNPYFEDRSVFRNLPSYGLDNKTVWGYVKECDDIVCLSMALERYILHRTGKRIWAEKTPMNIRLISKFLEFFPTARVIHIIRDPRDVVLSLIKRGLTPDEAAGEWLASVAAIQPFKNLENVLEIRYEDLVLDQEVVLKQISDFLEVDFKPEFFLTDRFQSKGVERRDGLPTWSADPAKSMFTGAIGKYKKCDLDLPRIYWAKLTKEYSDLISVNKEYTIGELVKDYGYSTECVDSMSVLYKKLYDGRTKRWKSFIDRNIFNTGEWIPKVMAPQRDGVVRCEDHSK